MKYQALARTWRPKSFEQMVGQTHVVKALSNALDQERLHHAYLFTGTRGVGKTTVARIFAKALNCEEGSSSNPCGVCSSCKSIDEGNLVDLIEVDAASRTGVDDTRELLDNVQYRPVAARYKIYLIDEVHMFSKSSFNALLKTLEEPPEHVKFLLATTDPKKCPITVLSRCLQFNLHPLSYLKIAEHLETILNKENIKFDKTAIHAIAHAANGSIRDSLSLLDQAIAFSPEYISEQNIVDMLGAASINSIIDLASFVANNQAQDCLDIIAKMAQSSVNFIDALDQLINLYHQLAVYAATQVIEDETLKQGFDKLVNLISVEEIQLNYQILVDGKRDFLIVNNSQAGFEMLILRLIAFRPKSSSEQAISSAQAQTTPVKKSTVQVENVAPSATVQDVMSDAVPDDAVVMAPEPPPISDSILEQSVPKQSAPEQILEPEPATQVSEPSPPALESFDAQAINAENWHIIVSQLDIKAVAKQVVNNCAFKSFKQGVLTLNLPEHYSIMLSSDVNKKLENALKQYSNDITAITIDFGEQESKAIQTPAQINHQTDLDEKEKLKQSFLNDPVIQSLQQDMDARLIPNSVQPIEK